MSRKVIIIISVVVFIAAGIFVYPKAMLFLKSRKATLNDAPVEFYIKSSCKVEQLAEQLFNAKLIDDKSGLMAVAEYKGINEENIALGKYIVAPGTEYRNLLNGFKLNDAGNGNGEVEIEVTFVNCHTLNDLAGKLSKQLIIDSTRFMELIVGDEMLQKSGLTASEIPAVFIPNTYKMYYDTDEQSFVDRMLNEYKQFWNDERQIKLKKKGLKSPVQVVTLASIVYAEQGKVTDEWPIIAGLYLNRLNQGIKLQSDPTFKFCWGDKLDGVQRLLNVHRDIDCPYNTYKITGLPPGPIGIPPSQVVDAVLNSASHDYVFMMAKPDYSGRHDFTVVYSDHEILAKKYQKWLAAELNNN